MACISEFLFEDINIPNWLALGRNAGVQAQGKTREVNWLCDAGVHKLRDHSELLSVCSLLDAEFHFLFSISSWKTLYIKTAEWNDARHV